MASTLIIIVSYNSAPILARCLETVRRQTLVPARIVVVDNDSEDAATLELLAHLTDVDVVRMDKNVGYGPAINAVALGSDGYDYLCCLNPDAFPASDWLAQLVGSLEADPELGSAASLLISDKDEQVLDGAGDELSIGGYPWRAGHDRRIDNRTLASGPVFSACAGACVYRMSAFKAVGGFDERFFMYLEDVDLGFRLQLAGFPCHLNSLAVATHIGSATTGYRSDFSVFYGHRNVELMLWKCLPLSLLPLVGTLHLFTCIALLISMARRRQMNVYLRAKYDSLRYLPTMLRERKKLRRAIGGRELLRLMNWRLIP